MGAEGNVGRRQRACSCWLCLEPLPPQDSTASTGFQSPQEVGSRPQQDLGARSTHTGITFLMGQPHPQGKPNWSGHMPPTTLHFRILHPSSETTFNGWREHKQHGPSHALILPTPRHRPRPLKFLVRHPLMRLYTGATWQVLRNVCTVRQGLASPP